MALIDFSKAKPQSIKNQQNTPPYKYNTVMEGDAEMGFVGNEYEKVKEHLGEIRQGAVVNFWTTGRYTMAGVVEYVIQQIGAVDVVACTWAVSKPAVETLLRLDDRGLIKSFRLWIDPRVKVRSPEPMTMLKMRWEDSIVISPVHAKVTCLANDDWKVSIFGSLNFTTSPQPERGAVCTVPEIWKNDVEVIMRQFK